MTVKQPVRTDSASRFSMGGLPGTEQCEWVQRVTVSTVLVTFA